MIVKFGLLSVGVALAFFARSSSATPVSAFSAKQEKYQVDQVEPRIIGGEEATPNEFPFLVRLTIVKPAGSFTCGGALVHQNWVLSAAHCFQDNAVWDPNEVNQVDVHIGAHQNGGDGTTVTVKSDQIYNHPSYDPSTISNDIALIQLPVNSHSVADSDLAQMRLDDEVPFGEELTVAGWGLINEDPQTHPTHLQKVVVPVITDEKCNEWTGNLLTLHDAGEVFCAGTEEGGKDSCMGDSGGPFFRKEGDDWVTYGVVSYGPSIGDLSCALPENPGIYAKPKFHKAWIETIMSGETYVAPTTPPPTKSGLN